jgi:cytochrome c-type biogenesis protein CcmH/NrfF
MLPPQQRTQMMDLIKATQAKEDVKRRAIDRLGEFVGSQAVSNYVGISGGNIK